MDDIRKRVEERAYQYFLDRGGQHGRDLSDWLSAEQAVLNELPRTKTAKKKASTRKVAGKSATSKVGSKKPAKAAPRTVKKNTARTTAKTKKQI